MVNGTTFAGSCSIRRFPSKIKIANSPQFGREKGFSVQMLLKLSQQRCWQMVLQVVPYYIKTA